MWLPATLYSHLLSCKIDIRNLDISAKCEYYRKTASPDLPYNQTYDTSTEPSPTHFPILPHLDKKHPFQDRTSEKSDFFFPCRVNNEDGSVNLEESCKAHIEELKAAQQQQVSQEERIKQLEAQVAALLEALQKGE